MHRTALGDFELTVFSDGDYLVDGGASFGVVPKVLWEKKVQADERNRLRFGLNALLIRTGRHTVLVETGIGDKLEEKWRNIYGNQAKLLADLQGGGASPEDIDVVINTHLHFDHCGWNTVRQGDKLVPTFPKARYYVQGGEVEHGRLRLERDRVGYLPENYEPLLSSGHLHLLDGDQEIVPGVSVKVYPGHTRDLQAVLVRSGGQTACFVSDLVPTTWHLDLTWVMAYDLFPLETIESRKRFYQAALREDWLVIFTHDPTTPFARLEKNEKGKMVARPLAATL
jgi:glyoxylase-like metal-dependent hydrolase (beta-lactamase superfamily II)